MEKREFTVNLFVTCIKAVQVTAEDAEDAVEMAKDRFGRGEHPLAGFETLQVDAECDGE